MYIACFQVIWEIDENSSVIGTVMCFVAWIEARLFIWIFFWICPLWTHDPVKFEIIQWKTAIHVCFFVFPFDFWIHLRNNKQFPNFTNNYFEPIRSVWIVSMLFESFVIHCTGSNLRWENFTLVLSSSIIISSELKRIWKKSAVNIDALKIHKRIFWYEV